MTVFHFPGLLSLTVVNEDVVDIKFGCGTLPSASK
jgi:hypothetical protein